MRYVSMLVLFALVLAGCGPSGSRLKRFEIEGSAQERSDRAAAILSQNGVVPGRILDARVVEDVVDNSGGMVPGPSDRYLSGVIRFAPEDLPKWRGALAPQIQPPANQRFFSPLAPPVWWPPNAAFDGCEYYAPDKLTGRMGGIFALSPTESAIYFSCF